MKRLLVLRLSALGDVIHTLPAVAALRDALPETTVSWVVEAPYRELVELVAGVDAIPVRMKAWARSPLDSRHDFRAALRALRGIDVSIDFQGLVKSAMLGALSGARLRAGFDRRAIREKPALLFTNYRVPVDVTRHVIEQNLDLARGTAGTALRPDAPLHWDRFVDATALEAFAGSVVILPGAGRANKIWPVARFHALARHIGPRALVAWGPGESDLAEATGARLAPPTTVRQLAGLLRNAALVIGADTGPLHLAAALGTPVIGLYGPTDPRRNGPYGQLDRCISRFQSTKLMESISVEEVVTLYEKVPTT